MFRRTCCSCNTGTDSEYEAHLFDTDTDYMTDTNTLRSTSCASTIICRENCTSHQEDDDQFQDLVFVDGNERDLLMCKNEDELMERVWQFSRPPTVSKQTDVIPARKVQVMRERLSASVKKTPPLSEVLREQIERNIKAERKVTEVKYEPFYEITEEDREPLCPNVKYPICTDIDDLNTFRHFPEN